MNLDERQERLRALTAEAARGKGRLPEHRADRTPTAGDLYVLPETSDFPVEWALLEPDAERPGNWLAVPADTNPLRGPGDVCLGPGEPGGPLCLRCRFGVRLRSSTLAGGRRTGVVSPEVASRALATWRDHERGTLQADPLAGEVAEDSEYVEWEREVLRPARAAARAGGTAVRRLPPAPSAHRPLMALAAAFALLSLGLGTWSWQLRERNERLSEPVLIGGTQEITVGTEVRGPATLTVRSVEERLLVFVVLEGDAVGYERYRVELTDTEGHLLWSSPEVERGPIPELNLVIPGRFLDERSESLRLVLFGLREDEGRRLAVVPLQIDRI